MSRKNLIRMRSEDQDDAETGSNSSSSDENLTLLAKYDDLFRGSDAQYKDSKYIYKKYRGFVNETINMHKQWIVAVNECRRLKACVDEKTSIVSDLESKLDNARVLLDEEIKYSRTIEEERNILLSQIAKTKELLFGKYNNQLPDAHKQFEFLNAHNYNDEATTAEEHTSGSILANYSYSRSEDDLDVSCKKWNKQRKTDLADQPTAKRPRSSMSKNVEISNKEKICATTTISVTHNGPITATSVIESIPMQHETELNGNYQLKQRCHNFQVKKLVKTETCDVCNKKIYFAMSCVKCKECRVICHNYCKDKVAPTCVPCSRTPVGKSKFGAISDHTPTLPPMIPAILIHCITEIEARGLDTVGLYRVSGAELEVKVLKEKLMKARGTPSLKDYDVATLCSVVKNFLRSLDESLIPERSCRQLVAAINVKDVKDITPNMIQVLNEMPQANRDTLAYILLHLKKISEAEACSMPISNLAKIFAVTLMFMATDRNLQNVCSDIKDKILILEFLLNAPASLYQNILMESSSKVCQLLQTPSADSLFQYNVTPISKMTRKKRSIFPTPEFPK